MQAVSTQMKLENDVWSRAVGQLSGIARVATTKIKQSSGLSDLIISDKYIRISIGPAL